MKSIKYWVAFFVLLAVFIPVTAAGASTYPSNSYISWKGQDWYVPNGQLDPGNNYWDNTGNGVWVDDQDRLHLNIKKDEDIWKCTEVSSKNYYRYGTFTWTVASPIYTFDKNSVVGLFTYTDDNHELDIEATRWGEKGGKGLWYSIQPDETKGHEVGYSIPPGTDGTNTKYRLVWEPTYVRFTAWRADDEVIADYNYTDIDSISKKPAGVVMNLWLNNATPPSDGKDIELIISDFEISNARLDHLP